MKKIIEAIIKAGGHPYLVGGQVRNKIWKEVHGSLPYEEEADNDVEVFGIEPEKLEAILTVNADRVDFAGKVYGIWHVYIGDEAFDFSIPQIRRDTGEGHKDEDTILVPNMPLADASARRDYTINSMMLSLRDNKLVDCHSGLADIRDKKLRATTSEVFGNDPCRPLIGMWLVSAFGLTPSIATIYAARAQAHRFNSSPEKRKRKEILKWASRGTDLPRGIAWLEVIGWGKFFPELFNLRDVMQDKEYHPEGDVFQHTMLVLKFVPEVCRIWNVPQTNVALAALMHDFGKARATIVKENGRITSPRHEEIVDEAGAFMTKFGLHNSEKEYLLKLVKTHSASMQNWSARRLLYQLDQIPLNEWMALCVADQSGRGQNPELRCTQDLSTLYEAAKSTPKELAFPIIKGRHLVEAGLKPGERFSHILARALKAQHRGVFSDLKGGKKWIKVYIRSNKITS